MVASSAANAQHLPNKHLQLLGSTHSTRRKADKDPPNRAAGRRNGAIASLRLKMGKQQTAVTASWCVLGLAAIVAGCGGENPTGSDSVLTDEASLNQVAVVSEGRGEDLNLVDISEVEASEYMLPPGAGYFMHKSCVHEVPEGATIKRNIDNGAVDVLAADGKTVSYQRCTRPMVRARSSMSPSESASDKLQPPFTNGWVAWSSASAPSNSGFEWFKEIYGKWYVPTNPSQNGGLLYFFNSLQSAHEIIQPVLQWGNNGWFGGNYWVFASWHVYTNMGGGAYYSPTHGAATGDYMRGDTWADTCVSTGLCSWHIQTYYWHAPGVSYSTQMNIAPFTGGGNQVGETFTRADQGVLENYNLTSCNQYPSDGSIQFYDTYVYEPKPTDISGWKEVWSAASWSGSHASGTTCGQAASVFNRSVFIDY